MAVDKLVDSTQLDNDLTSVANAIRTKGGTSAQLAFPDGFVSAVEAIPTGGNIVIASGEFIGSNNTQAGGRQAFSIGNKMAKTDFYVRVWAKDGEEFAQDGSLKWIALLGLCFKKYGYFDLLSDGAKSFVTSSYSVDSNNSGTITKKSAGRLIKMGSYLRDTGISDIIFNTFDIWRNRTDFGTAFPGFAIYLGHSNPSYPFRSVAFEYEVVYFGNDPTNDIVDLS